MAELWPASLPQVPIGDSVSYVAHDNVVRTQMEAGTAKLRPRYTAVGDDVTMALMCTRAQVDALQAFYETTLSCVLPFTWKHFRRPDWPAADYRFKSPPRFTPAGGNHWRAELELERLPASYGSGPVATPSPALQATLPANTSEPTISGGTASGSILTATPGSWSGTPTPVVIGQWQLKAESVWGDIDGATGLNYTTVDLGAHRYKETATNTAGAGVAYSSPITIATSDETPADAAPVNTVAPVITGDTTVGSQLTSGTGSWTGVPVPTYTYQWQQWIADDWADISGATSNTYTPTAAGDFRCEVTATNIVAAVAAYSNIVTMVAAQTAPANAVAPVVTGDTTVGSVLTSTTGTWSGNPAPTFAYQWQRFSGGAWANISGATSSTHTTAASGDHRCRVTATNIVDSAVAYSNTVNIGEVAEAPAMVSAPLISGNAYTGSTISALPGVWTGSGTLTYAYQWQVENGSTWDNVSGATSATYAPATAGRYACLVTASNDGTPATAVRSNGMSVSTAPAGAPPVSKTFTGAASDNLNVTTYDPTLSYFNNTAIGTEILVVKQATNSVHGFNTAGSLQAVYPNTRTFGARQKVTVTIHQTDAGSQVAAVVRWADYDNVIYVQAGTSGSNVVQKVAGNTPINYSLGTVFNNGDVLEVEINEAGTQLTVKRNGVHTAGGTWPSPITLTTTQPTGNLAGAGLWSATTGELASFTAFTVDDFSGASEAPALDYAPQILGLPTVGETLTSTRGVWFAAPEPTYAYLWQKWDGAAWQTATGSATSASYVPASGGDYRCRVTATNSAGATQAFSGSVTVAGGTVGTGTYTQARILFDEMHGGSEPMVAKLEFRASVGGSALTGTAFASSAAGALTAASKAFDSDATTYWEPSLDVDAVPYLGQTFATGQAIAQIALTFPDVEDAYVAAAPRSFRLQGFDGAEWITLKTVTNESAWTPGQTRTYTV